MIYTFFGKLDKTSCRIAVACDEAEPDAAERIAQAIGATRWEAVPCATAETLDEVATDWSPRRSWLTPNTKSPLQ